MANLTSQVSGRCVLPWAMSPISLPWADMAFRQRLSDFGKDDPLTVGCLPRGPRALVGSGPVGLLIKITQTPTVITVLFEDFVYRQIFLDGRSLPTNLTPSFMGYSVGR